MVSLDPIHSDLPHIDHVKLVSEFMQFASWASLPRAQRTPKTQKEFARQIGVSQDTLADWKRHPQFWNVTRHFLSIWMQERVPDVLHGLYKNARATGSAKEVEAFLRVAGGFGGSITK